MLSFSENSRNFQILYPKDLREYSCVFKNSWRFWNFSENARPVFLFSDFDRRNLANELREVFAFLVRAHELLMQNLILPLVSLGLTTFGGIIWMYSYKKQPFSSSARKSMDGSSWLSFFWEFPMSKIARTPLSLWNWHFHVFFNGGSKIRPTPCSNFKSPK